MTHRRPAELASLRMLAAGTMGVSLLVITTAGVLAGLNATTSNAAPQTVSSGTLRLTMSPTTPSAGFTTSITRLAPGDVVNRFIDLSNTGTLASAGLTVSVAATGSPTLITDGASTRALRVALFSCPVAWTQGSAVCPSGAVTEVTPKALSAFTAAQSLSTSALAADTGVLRLRVQVTLPDQDETTIDGQLPATTVQGGSVSLTYTFAEVQRTAQTTDS